MPQWISVVLSCLAFFVSVTTAWLTLWRKGKVEMTRPTILAIGPDGSSEGPPKVFLRALLYSTAIRGRVIETMYVVLRRGAAVQTFDVWAYGERRLNRGSGLFVGPTGVAWNHHFLPPTDTDFRFESGDYRIEIGAYLVGQRAPLSLHETRLHLSDSNALAINRAGSAVMFDWNTGAQRYIPQLQKSRYHEFMEGHYGPLQDE
jgi:hypothetical protein